MTDKPNGGSAFPRSGSSFNSGHSGMSLRDWFAGQAIAGACGPAADGWSLSPNDFATWGYQIADAMIAERAK